MVQMIDAAYLGQSFSRSLSQPMVASSIIGQPSVGWPSADQLSDPIPQLLSLWLQPDLKVLTQTHCPSSLAHPPRHPDWQDPIKLNYNG